MSHEIRTPINAVIGYSNLIMRKYAGVLNKEYLENIHISANHLLSLVNNVLEISKIESGKITSEKREINLEKLIEENLSMLSLAATEKGLLLKKGKIPALNEHLIGDPLKLRQVLSNLLGNAVKFTEKGYVELNVEILEENAEEIKLKFSVSDTGIGIPSDKIDSIFDRFTQASADTTRKYGGTGLGLTISKRIVNLQGGHLGVDSIPEKGSTFYFDLKFAKGTPLKKEETSDDVENEELLTGLNVLVVEDYILNIKILTLFLEMWGVAYAVAENGKEALNLMQQDTFDAILMDLHMPVMDGYEATRQIRASGNSVHIMALTANDDFSNKKELKEKGFDSFTLKPIDTKELHKKLKTILLKTKNTSANNS
jgi:CheY-like chemotaxis protein